MWAGLLSMSLPSRWACSLFREVSQQNTFVRYLQLYRHSFWRWTSVPPRLLGRDLWSHDVKRFLQSVFGNLKLDYFVTIYWMETASKAYCMETASKALSCRWPLTILTKASKSSSPLCRPYGSFVPRLGRIRPHMCCLWSCSFYPLLFGWHGPVARIDGWCTSLHGWF